MPKTNDIRRQKKADILEWFLEKGHPKFRANQVWEWLWKKGALSFDEMTNLSLSLREDLKSEFSFPSIQIETEQHSIDGTVKLRFELHDGHLIEGVLIPVVEEKRMTACVSSQVGCSLSCSFCATGFLKRERNLYGHEIYDQVQLINEISLKKFDMPLSNIVFMGMGEPLLNYSGITNGIDRLTAEDGKNISARRITVSTAGIAKMIKKAADDEVRWNLALSLHAANDEKRSRIMPINDQNDLNSLADALQYFRHKTGNKTTFEYILLNQFNDHPEDARELAAFVKRNPALINIIEYNQVEGVEFTSAKKDRLNAFVRELVRNDVKVTVRKSRGEDIDAACGQLANK